MLDALSDAALYRRGTETLLASWREYARWSSGAELRRADGVSAAVFPAEPERGVYNNAVLERGLGEARRAAAREGMEAVYAEAGVARFAAWVHESDRAMCEHLEHHGYKFDSATRTMGMRLDELRGRRPELDLAPAEWSEHLRAFDLPSDLLRGADDAPFHLVLARLGGDIASTGFAFDHAGDCGIYNVGTVPGARRRGLGTQVTALLLHDAAARGCTTASLQSTKIAEGVYRAVGFRDLGRFLEYVPESAAQ